VSNRILKNLKKTLSEVGKSLEDSEKPKKKIGKGFMKIENVVEETTLTPEELKHEQRRVSEYVEMEVTSSKGKKYRIVIPQSYSNQVPKKWVWTAQRYRVAEQIAEGIPVKQVAEAEGLHKTTIYAWLEHPEFREHVDGITLESGYANKRERIARLNRLTQKLEEKLMRELSALKLNEKSVGAILTAIGQFTKHLAQEKEEFVEASKVEQQTNVSGTIGVAHVNVEKVLNSADEEERRKLEEEFNKIGDDIIRSITGD